MQRWVLGGKSTVSTAVLKTLRDLCILANKEISGLLVASYLILLLISVLLSVASMQEANSHTE